MNAIPRALVGWIILAVLAGAIIAIMLPRINAYQDASAQIRETNEQIVRLTNLLAEPLPPRQSEPLRSLVLSESALQTSVSDFLRQRLLEAIRNSGVNLLEIEVSETTSSGTTITQTNGRVVVEGDIQHIVETLAQMARQGAPILVEDLSVAPISSIGEPDRSLRATISIALYSETGIAL